MTSKPGRANVASRRPRRPLVCIIVALLVVVGGLVVAPAARASLMVMPAWSQRDSRWAGMSLGGTSYTMGSAGCAVTSATMVADYYGSSDNPGQICQGLNNIGGLPNAELTWGDVPKVAGGTISGPPVFVGNGNNPTYITNELDAGVPVIVKFNLSTGTHWVVLTGHIGSTYYMNDPWTGSQNVPISPYGSISTVAGYVVYGGTHTPSDTTPPTTPVVTVEEDGPYSLMASWSATDPETGISAYQYAVGTTPGGADLKSWTPVGTAGSAVINDVDLGSQPAYVSVQAENGAGLWSSVGSSEAITSADGAFMVGPTTDQVPPRTHQSSYKPVITPYNAGLVPADTTVSQSFQTGADGMLALRYSLVFDTAGATVWVYVDGTEVRRYQTSQEGLGTSVSQMQYLFLTAGSHSVSFRTSGGSVYVLAVSAGLDTSYKPVITPYNAGLVPADTTVSQSFQTGADGMLALRYSLVFDTAGATVWVYVDGTEVRRYQTSQEGLGTSVSQMQYLFLTAGSHSVSFRTSGGSVYVLAVSAGLDTSYKPVITPYNAGLVPADTTVSQSFQTGADGMLALRYSLVFDTAGATVWVYVDGTKVRRYQTSQEGLGTSVSQMQYLFLTAGSHSVSFRTSGGSVYVLAVSAGLDTSYKPVITPYNAGLVPADTTVSQSFQTGADGMLALRYSLVFDTAGATVWVYVDGTEVRRYQTSQEGLGTSVSQMQYLFLTAGSHSVSFRTSGGSVYVLAVSAGLFSPAPADTTSPTTTVSGADGRWHNTPVTLTLHASDNSGGSGVAATYYKVDSGAWTQGTSVTITAPADHTNDGAHTVRYYSTDLAGNSEAARSVTVKIDTCGPATAARATSGRRGHALTLRYRISDALSPSAAAVHIVVRTSHGKLVRSFACAPCTTGVWHALRWVPKARGSFCYYVYARDLAGNAQVTVGSARVDVR